MNEIITFTFDTQRAIFGVILNNWLLSLMFLISILNLIVLLISNFNKKE